MQELLDLILSDTLYMVIAAVLIIGILFFILKKVFKLFLMIVAVVLAYAVFLFMTEDDPLEAIREKLSMGQTTIKKLDEATQDLQDETMEKVMEEVDKKLKEAAGK